MSVGRYCWHVHHDLLLEPLTEPIEARQEYIRTDKPKEEHALRLRLLRVVQGEIPVAYDQARQAYDQAGQALDQAGQAYDQARQAYDQARQAYAQAGQAPEVLALHALECPNCPWDGKTIFPEAMTP